MGQYNPCLHYQTVNTAPNIYLLNVTFNVPCYLTSVGSHLGLLEENTHFLFIMHLQF